MPSLFNEERSGAGLRFEVGAVYSRRDDLHARYGGQQQGGISTPADHPLVFLFTSDAGEKYGYRDGFRPDGVFRYTGEGQTGDMRMIRGNRAIRDHRADGNELHLFRGVGDGQVEYRGRAFYLSHHWEERPDANGDLRRAVVFELQVETEAAAPTDGDEVREPVSSERSLDRMDLDELWRAALAQASPSASEEERRRSVCRRSKAIRRYVRARAGGRCEGCGEKAPFRTSTGRPYLEAHHVRRVADDGPDHPRWVIALCPTCHRRVHHGQDGEAYNDALKRRLGEIEGAAG
jgi:5-methylcytosine-specific restriction protein A